MARISDRQEITNRIDESLFKSLYDAKEGAPNAPIRVLMGMIILIRYMCSARRRTK